MEPKISKNLNETNEIARDFLDYLSTQNNTSHAMVVGLTGNLGSGKTTFTKSIGELLGVKETIQSPTFIIQKSYDTTHSKWKKLYHLDLYRIEDPKELEVLHLKELFDDSQNLVLIEWPEKAEGAFLPDDMIKVTFEFIDETTRNISYEE